jgi:hypothetical protein
MALTIDVSTLVEYKEKFVEIGGADQEGFLVMAEPGATSEDDPIITTLDLQGLFIVNERGLHELLINRSISVANKTLFTIYGGVLDLDPADNETPLGRSSVILPKFRAAMHPAGGIQYGDTLYRLNSFHHGLIITGACLEFFCVAEGPLWNT